ncbi:MAG TPA: SCP2 sterol-binding domain-containing protein [Acidimicrobiales bacterium]|nr:SCP2 sterol-binding domain-containing protein [Acidimicrobiales bacterium]
MPNPFLSDAWLDEVESLEAPPATGAAADLVLNVVVPDRPEGPVELNMAGGKFNRGLADNAPTKVTIPFETAKAMFVDGNPQAAMQAFMAGQIKVEGDMTKLMAMQSAGGPTPEQTAFQEKIKSITA